MNWASRSIVGRSSGCWAAAEKKTTDAESIPISKIPDFASAGGRAQARYERVRAYALTDPADRPRVSPAQFDLHRLQRLGLLGLLDRPVHHARTAATDFELQLIPLVADDFEDRVARLCELLGGMLAERRGGENATSGTVCPGLDRAAGEGADDREPAGRDYPVCR
jgi:hypothetical protein